MDIKVLGHLPHFNLNTLRLLRTLFLACTLFSGLLGCQSQPGAPVVDATPGVLTADQPIPPELQALIDEWSCLLYTSPSPRDATLSRMPSSA